jgi:hypothetical protein
LNFAQNGYAPGVKRRRESKLEKELGERDAEGIAKLPADEQDAVLDAAEHNPDPTTRREAMEQELMELDESEAGADTGD